jgi:hypothetical protein
MNADAWLLLNGHGRRKSHGAATNGNLGKRARGSIATGADEVDGRYVKEGKKYLDARKA